MYQILILKGVLRPQPWTIMGLMKTTIVASNATTVCIDELKTFGATSDKNLYNSIMPVSNGITYYWIFFSQEVIVQS